MLAYCSVTLSIIFQTLAAILAVRLIKITRWKRAWIFIAAAMIFQAFRRIIILAELISGRLTPEQITGYEGLGLAVSVFMFVGVIGIGPVFKKMFRETTEREQLQTKTLHLNEALCAIGNINQLMISGCDQNRLFGEACRILAQINGYCMVWIGLVGEGHKKVIPVARAGEHADYLDKVIITWDESSTGCGPTGAAIKTRQPGFCRNMATDPTFEPWRKEALGRGFASSAVIPLIYGKQLFGVLNVYAKIPDFFSNEETKILGLLGNNIACAIQKIETDKALWESENKFKELYEDAPLPYQSLDETGNFLYVNNAWVETLGYTKEDVIGKNFAEFLAGDWAETFRGRFPRFKSDGKICAAQFEMRRKDGSSIWVEFEGRIGHKPDGSFKKTHCIFINITERKRAEEELMRYKNGLEEALINKGKILEKTYRDLEDAKRLSDIGTLAATVAHELRNPLGVIRTAIYNIKQKAVDSSFDSQIINIDKKIKESEQIIANLLSYSRIKEPYYEAVPVLQIMNLCADNCRNKYAKWDVELDIKSNCATDFTIEADSLHLSELFSNILDNAYQSLPDKKGNIEVNIDFKKEDGVVNMAFRDNGTGIDENDVPSISKPFFTTKSRGTGLGLSVCKQIVNLHKGELDFETAKGEGTTVTLRLPVRRPT